MANRDMIERIEYLERHALILESPFLQGLLYELDEKLCSDKEYIKDLEDKVKELQDDKMKRLNADIENGNRMMGAVLMSALSTEVDGQDMGPVGATMLSRIKDMQTIEEVHQYIEKVFDHNRKKMKKKKKKKVSV